MFKFSLSNFYKPMNVCLDRKLNNGKSILRDKQNMIREFHAERRKLAKVTFHPHKFL